MTNMIYNILNRLIKTRAHSAWQMLLLGDLEYRLFRINQFNLSTAKMHEKTFTPFKNKFAGKEVAIIACGPSLNNYNPLPNVINIGVNRAYKDTRIVLDYLFVQDVQGCSREELKEFNNYRKNGCQKFYGISWESLDNDYPPYIVSESDVISACALRYRTHKAMWIKGLIPRFPLDISTQPLADYSSVVFSAIQFALWTNPKTIYLVGCDCTNIGHFYEQNGGNGLETNEVAKGYSALKSFARAYYPDTEIVSINPVGLKGLFKDIYQEKGSK